MDKKGSGTTGSYTYTALIVIALILIAYFSRMHVDPIKKFVQGNLFLGLLIYILVGIFDAVIGPGVSIPLIQIAARVWGPLSTALLTIAGWVSGSLAAFLLVKTYGRPLLKHFISLERLEKVKTHIPKKRKLFWSIVLVRFAFPMDIFSYTLALFTGIRLKEYISATALGVAPSAFVLAYIGKLPIPFEVAAYLIGGAVFIWLIYFVQKIRR